MLTDHPRCTICPEPADEVDHIQPLALGGAQWDRGNLQPLCSEHHRAKTRQDRYRIRQAREHAQ